MLAGAAHVDFTPAPGLILQGHYTTQPSTSVLHPLEARAAAFCLGERTVIVISLDLVGVSLATTTRIRDRLHRALQIHPNNVLVAASHTHCAPATVDLLSLRIDPAFLERVETAAVECATKAIADLRPARLGIGCSAAHFNVNRRPLPLSSILHPLSSPPSPPPQFSVNEGGICDKRVRVLRVDDLRGRPLALLFHYACHPTSLPGSQGLISSDFPGVARSLIEHDLGCPALFLQGCSANLRPRILNPAGEFTPATPDQLLSLGQQLASAAIRAARSTKTTDADLLDARQTDLTLPYAHLSTEQLQAHLHETTPAARAVKHPWSHRTLEQLRTHTLPPSETTTLQLLRIGPLSLLGIPGEPVQEIAHSLERLAAPTHPDLWPTGYTNDMPGYLVTEPQKSEGGYEPTAYPYFNRPAPFQNEQSQIERAATQLLGL